jgi:pimeloyl-ACP methyl ester carboxylesterase
MHTTLVAFAAFAVLSINSALVAANVPTAPESVGGLRRGASLGVAMDTSAERPTIRTVAPGSSAERFGLRAGDVIESVDRNPVDSSRAFVSAIVRKRAGDAVIIAGRRGNDAFTVEGALAAPPLEQQADYDIEYRSLAVDGAKRRVIVTRPRHAKDRPAVLLIGGVGCYSVDGLLRGEVRQAYGKVLDGLTRAGYVTLRIEKTGMGDSEGVPCQDPRADFDAEVRGFRAGLEHLESLDGVDRRQVFIFSHSMGPLVAARIAAEHPVRGIVVAETVGTSWFEYDLTNLRRQLVLGGMAYDEAERLVRQREWCMHQHYVEKKSADEVVRANRACAEDMRAPAPWTYMQQVAAVDLAALWKRIDAPALIFYGTADFVTDSYQHEYLRDMINSFRPNNARYVVVDGMDHGLTISESQRAAREGVPNAPFAQRVLDETILFFNGRLRG